MGKISETWKSEITFLEENNGEMEIEITCINGNQKKVYRGFINEV